jgi:hypothetical protein
MIQWLLNRKTEKGFLPNSRNNPDINRYLQTLSLPDYRKQEDSKKERPRNDSRETREDFRRSDYRRDERGYYREDDRRERPEESFSRRDDFRNERPQSDERGYPEDRTRREREPERNYYSNETSRNTMFGNRNSENRNNLDKRKDREYDKNLPNKRKPQ